jgi:hypothetical protein
MNIAIIFEKIKRRGTPGSVSETDRKTSCCRLGLPSRPALLPACLALLTRPDSHIARMPHSQPYLT